MTLRPPMPYYGGKTLQAARIVDALPPHEHYVEPYAGSLAVLLSKPRATMETVNDLDGDLMLFWRVLRDQPEALARACALTPHSRAEHAAAYDLAGELGDLERARRVWILLSQGRGATLRSTGWRFYRNPAGSTYAMPEYLGAYVQRILPVAERLAGVSLECRDALEVIADYGQHPGVLLYVDPPYLGATRAANYRHELTSEADHCALLSALQACKGAVVLSGYPSDLYAEALAGWHRSDAASWTGNGIRSGATKTDGDRTEVIWSNRPIGLQAPLDFGGAHLSPSSQKGRL